MMKLNTFLAASLALLGGCTLPTTQADVPAAQPGGWESGISTSQGPLYGRDGAPVGSTPNESVTVANDTLNHSPNSAGDSRPKMLELYQEAVSDREYLQMELALVTEEREGFLDDQKRFAAQIEELRTLLAGLEAKNKTLEKQTFELGERLATAQLRRLEAEKALLEASLAARKAAEANAAEEVE